MFSGLVLLFHRSSVARRVFALCAVTCLLLAAAPASPGWATEDPQSEALPRVGIVLAPPFAMKDRAGNWQGIAVDLWRHVADDLGLRFEWRELAISELIAELGQGKLLAVATATASAERELLVDFSHPYYSSGLAIAVPTRGNGDNWFAPLGNLISVGTAKITGLLLGLLLVAAVLVWRCEHRVNPDHFSPRPLRGIADGFWWAAVTLTTVGYGDKAPRTVVGRAIGVIWMFAAVILLALFTAQVTSSLTVQSLGGRVRGPADLPHVRVGTVQASQSQAVLRSALGVTATGYASFGEGLEALAHSEIDAFVGVEPVLRYEIANRFPGRLTIVGTPFLRADYVFALPLETPIRKQVNHSLLEYIETNEWRRILRQYLGGDG